MIPQLIMLGLMCIGLGVGLSKHGEAQARHNIVIDLISVAVQLGLLYWGGFFDCFFN